MRLCQPVKAMKNIILLEYYCQEMKLQYKKQILSFAFLLFLWDNGLQKFRIPLHFAKCKPLNRIQVLQWLSCLWEIFIMWFSQFPLTFYPAHSRMPCFISQLNDYSCADWDGLFCHLRDAPWEDIFKLSVSVPAN